MKGLEQWEARGHVTTALEAKAALSAARLATPRVDRWRFQGWRTKVIGGTWFWAWMLTQK